MENNKNKEFITVYSLVLIGTIAYVSLIFNQNVWLDEAFTASLVRNTDMAGVLQRSMNDTLPPFYNILLKLMTDIFGYHIPVMKITSVMPMVASMLLGASVVRKRFGMRVSSLFIIAIAAMPQMLFYGVEIRMYSWGFFFALASAVYAFEVIHNNSKKNWCIFILFSVGAGYTHHFAFVAVGFVYLYLLIYFIVKERSRIKQWMLCLAATGILYFPCMLLTLRQMKKVSGYFSMPEVTLQVFIKYMRYPYTVGFTPLSVLLLLCVELMLIYGLVQKKKQITVWYGLACISIYYGVLLFGTVVSKLMTANIFVDRYLFFSIGILWLGFCVLVQKIPTRIYGVILLLFICTGIVGYRNQWKMEYDHSPETLKLFLSSQSHRDKDTFVICEPEESLLWCIQFYYPDAKVLRAEAVPEEKDSFWCVVDTEDGQEELEALLDRGYESEYMGEFRFDRYTLDLYYLEE